MDSKSLDEIMSSRDEEVQPEPTNDGPVRDDQGRFAAKDAAEAALVQPEPDQPELVSDPEAGKVPQQALHASREREKQAKHEAEQLRQQIAQMQGQINLLAQQPRAQPQPEPEVQKTDFWSDPDNYLNQALSPVQKQIQEVREGISLSMAKERHGEEVVGLAYQAMAEALQSDPSSAAEYARIMKSPHPFGELVTWHQRRQSLAEIGDDPKAYRERLRAEIMAELQTNQQPAPAPQPAAQRTMPTSFAQARSEGQRAQPTYTGPKPLSEIMDR